MWLLCYKVQVKECASTYVCVSYLLCEFLQGLAAALKQGPGRAGVLSHGIPPEHNPRTGHTRPVKPLGPGDTGRQNVSQAGLMIACSRKICKLFFFPFFYMRTN